MTVNVSTHQEEDDIIALIAFFVQTVGLHEFFHVGIAQLTDRTDFHGRIIPIGENALQVLLHFQFECQVCLRILMRA